VVWEGRSREAPPYPDLWHETDMSSLLRNVRSRGQSGKHRLALSFSGFDRTHLGSRACTAMCGATQCAGLMINREGLWVPISLAYRGAFFGGLQFRDGGSETVRLARDWHRPNMIRTTAG
jgi:hypothetical protein